MGVEGTHLGMYKLSPWKMRQSEAGCGNGWCKSDFATVHPSAKGFNLQCDGRQTIHHSNSSNREHKDRTSPVIN